LERYEWLNGSEKPKHFSQSLRKFCGGGANSDGAWIPSKNQVPAQVLKFSRRNLHERAGFKICGCDRRHYRAESAGADRGECLRKRLTGECWLQFHTA